MTASAPFTFVCLAQNQVATLVDVQDLDAALARRHALQLLRDHASTATVEIWRDEAIWEVVARDGLRAIQARDEGDASDPMDLESAAQQGSTP